MSIDSSEQATSESQTSSRPDDASEDAELWESVRAAYRAAGKKDAARKVFGTAAKRGAVYRWGIAVATGGPCGAETDLLSRLACGQGVAGKKHSGIDLVAAAERFSERVQSARSYSAVDASEIVLWAAALPALSDRLDQTQWSGVLHSIHQARESVLQQNRCYTPEHLILGAELGLTLAWRLDSSRSGRRLVSSSIVALTEWCNQDAESVSDSNIGAVNARLVLASFLRARRILDRVCDKRLGKRKIDVGAELATWVAAMTVTSGGSAFSAASRSEVADDLSSGGLLAQAIDLDRDSLAPAMDAALGAAQSGGRLVWQIDLPSAFHHDPEARLCMMFSDWDVRRGRTHIDYSGDTVKIEVFAGRPMVLSGLWETMIEIDGQEQKPCGDWSDACEYTDDDVHYLEIEQPWTANVLLQRQILLFREDRCLLLSDAVLPQGSSEPEHESIKYASRLPLCSSIEVDAEEETRELFLGDGRRRGMVLPLSGSEWRMAPSVAELKGTQDEHLLLSSQGQVRLYAPLWFDFQQRRFKRKRTWRQLTVAEQLRIMRRDEAVGYRVQVGSEQWMVYRSLAGTGCRTILGKHLISDFFVSRFDPGDGSHDELLTVDDNESHDDE